MEKPFATHWRTGDRSHSLNDLTVSKKQKPNKKAIPPVKKNSKNIKKKSQTTHEESKYEKQRRRADQTESSLDASKVTGGENCSPFDANREYSADPKEGESDVSKYEYSETNDEVSNYSFYIDLCFPIVRQLAQPAKSQKQETCSHDKLLQ